MEPDPNPATDGTQNATRAGLVAIVLLVVIAILGVRATGSLRVTLFAGPVLIATGAGVVLGGLGRPTGARGLYATASALSITFGVITIFSVGIMFLAVGGLLAWAAQEAR